MEPSKATLSAVDSQEPSAHSVWVVVKLAEPGRGMRTKRAGSSTSNASAWPAQLAGSLERTRNSRSAPPEHRVPTVAYG